MRSNRRRNWLIKRIALGFAVAAFAAPVAQAKVDEGSIAQAQAESSVVRAHTYQPAQASGSKASLTDFPGVNWKDPGIVWAASNYKAFMTDFPSSRVHTVDGATQPRSIGEPQVVSAGFDWQDAGIGAGLALALVLLAGGAVLTTRHAGREQTA
jgi:hypothetical protein